MKYKGIELEGLDKEVRLAHSRFFDRDEGTDWIDKLLTCDKAALTPTQFHEVSALSSVINMDYQICNGGIGQYVGNGYHEYRAPYSDDDVAQLDKREQDAMLCMLADLGYKVFPESGEKNDAVLRWAGDFYIGFDDEKREECEQAYYDVCDHVAFLCEAYAQYLCKSYGID